MTQHPEVPEKKGKLNQREPRFSAPRNSECSCAEGRRAEEPKSRRAEGPKITPARDDWSAGSGGNPYLIGRRVANAGGGPRVERPRCQGSLGSRGSRKQGFPCPRAPAAGLRTSAAEWRRGASASRGLFACPGWRAHRGIAPLGREPPASAAASELGQFCGAALP